MGPMQRSFLFFLSKQIGVADYYQEDLNEKVVILGETQR
jgi:hypothetical protein